MTLWARVGECGIPIYHLSPSLCEAEFNIYRIFNNHNNISQQSTYAYRTTRWMWDIKFVRKFLCENKESTELFHQQCMSTTSLRWSSLCKDSIIHKNFLIFGRKPFMQVQFSFKRCYHLPLSEGCDTKVQVQTCLYVCAKMLMHHF